jgi:glycosyltransferase involved in cell wall biosynthesis
MRIAILGTRGIPASYGGFETFAQELSTRLVERGHDVTVYCRTGNRGSPVTGRYGRAMWRGVRLIVLPALRTKYLETISHTLLSALHATFARYDACLFCNAANALFLALPRLSFARTAINVDGIERKRAKWNAAGRAWYRLGEWLSTVLAHRVVSDARVIAEYYLQTYGKRTDFIPYGAPTDRAQTRAVLDRFGLERDGYVLYVSRLEPENNAHVVIRAFEQVRTDKRLVIVGDAPYARDYIASLKTTRDPRILFTGYVFGEGYRELQSNSFCYVHATDVGGTHPALIEGMGLSSAVVANHTPENAEVIGGGGLLYQRNDSADLARILQEMVDDPSARPALRERALLKVEADYSWTYVTDRYEQLLLELAEPRPVLAPEP